MKKKNGLGYASVLLGMALILSACAGQPAAEPVQGSVPVTGASSSQKEEVAGVDRTVTHAMGTAKITGTPQTVVVLDNGALDNLLALGVKPSGAPTVFLDDPYPEYLAAQAEGIRNIGTIDEPNLESIAAIKPDLILGSKDTHEAIYSKLEQIAPTVFVETLGFTWKDNLKLQAEALGKSEEAEKLLAAYQDRLKEFQGKLGDRLKETEVSILRPRSDHVRIYLKSSFSGNVIEDAGLPRPAVQDKAEFAAKASEEQVQDMAGDVIFWFSRDTDNLLQTKLKNNPLWQQLDAVKENKVFEVNAETWLSGLGYQAANLIVDDLFTLLVNE